MKRAYVLFACLATAACSRADRAAPGAAQAAGGTPAQSAGGATSPAPIPAASAGAAAPDTSGFAFLGPLTTGPIPPDVAAACDTVNATVSRAIGLAFARTDGSFKDFTHGDARTGCRLQAHGVLRMEDTVEATAVIAKALAPARWAMDLRYSADGAGSTDIGLRRRTVLCEVNVSSAGDDDDADSTAAAAPPDSTSVVVLECVRDLSDNHDAGVPDQLWGVATQAGLDSVYAIDLRLQYPPYLDGDFDGDGKPDAAVLVTQRATGKLGIAFVLGGSRQVAVAGAGTPLPGGGDDDLSWIEEWDHITRGVNYDILHRPLPATPGDGDALRLQQDGNRTLFLLWRAGRLTAEVPRR